MKTSFDPLMASIEGYPTVERRLSQLQGVFADPISYEKKLVEENDPLIYTVSSVEPAEGEGQLHYGIGKIMPGRVGQEFFMTRGHYHEWRKAAEIYIGFSGTGLMLLETEGTDDVQLFEFTANTAIYVPGFTAHRTINIGDEPLTYIGIYPAKAGHDYGTLAQKNFNNIIVENEGMPKLLNRNLFVEKLLK